MTNRDLLNKSVTDMTNTEKTEMALMAKNLMDALIKRLPKEEAEKCLDEYGVARLIMNLK